ncbi:MAG: esterase/lipase family protein [Chloroflexota bacterium]
MKRGYLCASLAIALLGAVLIRSPAAAPVRASAAHHLYVMFLPGLCGWPYTDPQCHGAGNATRRARATFGTLISAMRHAGIRHRFLAYSYNPRTPNAYSIANTHQPIKTSIAALQKEIQRVRSADPGARFDLVAHSLGGVIAAGWSVGDARKSGPWHSRGVRSYIHAVITFDSPLRGLQSSHIGNLLSRLFGGAVWKNLNPNAPVIRSISSQSQRWWTGKGHLYTVANSADLIVPPSEALLGHEKRVTDSNCSQDLGFLRSCHGAVLQDRTVNRWVACHWIASPSQCAAATATPSPSPVPSPSPTPSIVPTATPTSLPPPPPPDLDKGVPPSAELKTA